MRRSRRRSYGAKRRSGAGKQNVLVTSLFIIAILAVLAIVFVQLRNFNIIPGGPINLFNKTLETTPKSEFLGTNQTQAPTDKSTQAPKVQVLSKNNYNLDVNYDLQINVDFTGSSAQVNQKTTFTNNTSVGLDKIYFRLYPNILADPTKVPIDSTDITQFFPSGIPEGLGIDITTAIISLNNKKTTGELKGSLKTTLEITPEKPILPGETVEVGLDYLVNIPVGQFKLSKTPFVMNLSYLYAKLAEFENGEWQYSSISKTGSPWNSNVANFKASIEVDKKYTIASTGKILTKLEREDGRNIYTINAENARDFALGVSTKAIVFENQKSTVISFARADKSARTAAEIAEPIIEYYAELFNFPIKHKINLVQTKIGNNICAQSEVIFYDEKLSADTDLLSWYLAKAIAQQYFGVIVEGNSEFNEQLSIFAAAQYFEEIKSPFEYTELIPQDTVGYKIYQARKQIGTIKFDAALQSYISENSYKSGGAAKFIAASNNDSVIADALKSFAIVQNSTN